MSDKTGRPNQKQRTRKDLLDAAGRLTRQGHSPSLEEVAAEALVSRATAYRYFPSIEALQVEAAVHLAMPAAEEIFARAPSADPVARVRAVERALATMMSENEVALRTMLAHTVQQAASAGGDLPARQNRRSPLIAEALEPSRDEIIPELYESLVAAIAALVGIEGVVVFKDVLQLNESQAREIRQWAIGALVEAARRKA